MICRNSRIQTGVNQTKSGYGKELLDKGCLYLRYFIIISINNNVFIIIRLFLGMGVIWYFEIISWYTGNDQQDQKWAYMFDVINMMQVCAGLNFSSSNLPPKNSSNC